MGNIGTEVMARDCSPIAITWRPYQRQATNALVLALKSSTAPVAVLPTGSGKSLIIADAAKRAYAAGLRTLIIAPSRELVEQDYAAVLTVSGNALVPSIACAGLGQVDLSGAVIIGTPDTIARHLDRIGHIDLFIIDEAQRLSRNASSRIHTTLSALRARNPKLMVCGLTATPFRLDSGLLTEGPDRIFDRVAFEIGYLDLVNEGYLAPLVGPRQEIERLQVAGLRIVAGDYSASDLARFDENDLTARIADQIVALGMERKSWLVFGVSVEHATHLCEALVFRGIDARLLTGSTPAHERADLVAEFKARRIPCLVGVDVFSVGFDAPAVDLIAIARPTASPVWHVQSAGRGTRIAPGKRDCLILDFAGNFARLGPIDAPHIRHKGERTRNDQDAPLVRGCPHCDAIIAARSRTCPVCNTVIEAERPRRTDGLSPNAGSITGADVLPVRAVNYRVHRKAGRPDSLRIAYDIAGRDSLSEWLCAWHPGWIGQRARSEWWRRLAPGAPRVLPANAQEAAAIAQSRLRRPDRIRIRREGGFSHVTPLFGEASS
jgi:DNA repair protein RadD